MKIYIIVINDKKKKKKEFGDKLLKFNYIFIIT